MGVYVITMYRWGDREQHSYVYTITFNKTEALKEAFLERENRGGKYEPEVLFFKREKSGTIERSLIYSGVYNG